MQAHQLVYRFLDGTRGVILFDSEPSAIAFINHGSPFDYLFMDIVEVDADKYHVDSLTGELRLK